MKSIKPLAAVPPIAEDLRLRAESITKSGADCPDKATPCAERQTLDALKLCHELQVHQVELELQHEELNRATAQVHFLLAEYSDLYDFAPVGYFTIDSDSRIKRVNLTGAELLGMERTDFSGILFRKFVATASRTVFSGFLSNLKNPDSDHVCVVRLANSGGAPAFVQLNAKPTATSDLFRMTVTDITERMLMESHQTDQAERIKELSRSLVRLQETERRKLGTELHDRTSGNLAALSLLLKDLGEHLPAPIAAELAPKMEDIKALLVETTRSIREISSDIRPPLLDHCGLVPALEDYISKFVSHTGIKVEFTGKTALSIDAELESSLFRIVQEALTNCAKHSHAKTVKIELRNPADKVALSIIDDGLGFLSDTLFEPSSKPGLGILSMRERAEFLGGTFRLTSTQGKGTKILVEFKLTRAQRQAAWTKRQHDRRQAGANPV